MKWSDKGQSCIPWKVFLCCSYTCYHQNTSKPSPPSFPSSTSFLSLSRKVDWRCFDWQTENSQSCVKISHLIIRDAELITWKYQVLFVNSQMPEILNFIIPKSNLVTDNKLIHSSPGPTSPISSMPCSLSLLHTNTHFVTPLNIPALHGQSQMQTRCFPDVDKGENTSGEMQNFSPQLFRPKPCYWAKPKNLR